MGCAASKGSDIGSSQIASVEKRFKGTRRLSDVTTHFGYFCNTAMLKRCIIMYPELMLLPWEHQRRMGTVTAADPAKLTYAFVSHQWETPEHPFPDLKQVTEHLAAVKDAYIWLDWYCVPQWSRKASPYPEDPLAVTVFLMTMQSFHRLCALSTTSLAIVKRGTGLKLV